VLVQNVFVPSLYSFQDLSRIKMPIQNVLPKSFDALLNVLLGAVEEVYYKKPTLFLPSSTPPSPLRPHQLTNPLSFFCNMYRLSSRRESWVGPNKTTAKKRGPPSMKPTYETKFAPFKTDSQKRPLASLLGDKRVQT
jgi:hypothetical protein